MTNGSNTIRLLAVNIAIFVDFHSLDGLVERQHNVVSQFAESNFQMTARVAKYLCGKSRIMNVDGSAQI